MKAPQDQVVEVSQNALYEDKGIKWMLYNIGSIPEFLAYALTQPERPLAESMVKMYGMAGAPIEGGELDDVSGVYKYPEDPELEPIARCTCARGVVYIYPYGIVAVCEDGEDNIIYRMD